MADAARYQRDDEAVENVLADVLMRLKFSERNLIREEVHGVTCLAPEETPELIRNSLAQMEKSIGDILASSPHKHVFEHAMSLPDSFVHEPEHRLRFLRCEFFDPFKAADRMIVYLDYVHMIFGPRAVMEPLKADFFSKEEAAALRQGNIQILPFRDSSGRRVVVGLPGLWNYSPRLRVKLFLYISFVAMSDIETQRKGIVSVVWNDSPDDTGTQVLAPFLPGARNGVDRIILPSGRPMEDGLPLRFAGIHFCFQQTKLFRITAAFYVASFPDHMLSRLMFHHGTRLEVRYKLMSFGLPVSYIPVTDTGATKLKYHNQWLKLRKQIETGMGGDSRICECPSSNDVLFRRAGSCLSHPGNARFKHFIECEKERHEKANQTGKRDIAWSIVEKVESIGGRFFSWCKVQSCWKQILDRSEIRFKVAMSLRDYNKDAKGVSNIQVMDSSTFVFQERYGNSRKRKMCC